MKYSAYVLCNKDEKYYIGHTNNISRRMDQHNDLSRISWTTRYAPWQLMYAEDFLTKSEAMKKEKYLKSFKNKNTLKKYISENGKIGSNVLKQQ